MPTSNDTSTPSRWGSWSLSGRTRWAAVVAVAVIVSALAALGIESELAGTTIAPVAAVTIAAVGGAIVALWIVEGQPD